jgi:hypothetical protein
VETLVVNSLGVSITIELGSEWESSVGHFIVLVAGDMGKWIVQAREWIVQ